MYKKESVGLGTGSSGTERGFREQIRSKWDLFWLWHNSILKDSGMMISLSCSSLGWKSMLTSSVFLGSYRIHFLVPSSCWLNKNTGTCRIVATAMSSICDPHSPFLLIRLQYAVLVKPLKWFWTSNYSIPQSLLGMYVPGDDISVFHTGFLK